MPRDVKLDDLIASNPNFEQQMRDWQNERHQKGENPLDWQAFRELEMHIGAPDPGEDAPAEFYWFTPPAGVGAAMPAAAEDTAFGAGVADAFSGTEPATAEPPPSAESDTAPPETTS